MTITQLTSIDGCNADTTLLCITIQGIKVKVSSIFLVFAIASAAILPGLSYAQSTSSPAASGAQPTAPTGDLAEGEVRKVDKAANKITLKHGEIKNLDMPGMTMVFQVKDSAMLNAVKAGDKVMFTADKVNGALTVTSIKPMR